MKKAKIGIIGWPRKTMLTLYVVCCAVTLPIAVIVLAAELPMFIRLLPRSRFGRSCSANSVVCSRMMILAGVGFVVAVDRLKWFCHSVMHVPGDYYYRLIFVWSALFIAVASYFRITLYRYWLKLGGDDNYIPPRLRLKKPSKRHTTQMRGLQTA